jgi:hypothetical protein
VRGAKGGYELGAIGALNWKLDAKGLEHLAHARRIRMPATQFA